LDQFCCSATTTTATSTTSMFRPAVLMRNESMDMEPSTRIVPNRQFRMQESVDVGEDDPPNGSFTLVLSSRVESRRKYALVVSILDLILGLGQLVYHINRAVYVFDYSDHRGGSYDHLSWASYILWTLTFLMSTLQISMAICLLTASYSQSALELSRGRIRKASFWVMTSQLLLTLLIIKIIILTASSQLEFELGVFHVLLEDPTSIWFVLVFYSLQIVFRGFAIYLIKKYIQYLE